MLFNRRPSPLLEEKQSLYEEHFTTVYKIAFYITHSETLAEDVTHETFKVALEKFDQVRDPTKIGGWLAAIATNLSKDLVREYGRCTPMESGILYSKAVINAFPLKALVEKETTREIKNAIGNLPHDFKQVIILRYYDALSIKELARSLKIPVGTVKSRLYRAKKTLKASLDNEAEKTTPSLQGGISHVR